MKLTEAEARNRLAVARVARLATVGTDGRPHLVPVTFALEGGNAYIAIDHKPKTTTNLRRLRNIWENPRVALLADHYEDDWSALWWVRADGHARILETGEDQQSPIDFLAAKYVQYREFRPEGPVIAIEVHRWTGWAALTTRYVQHVRHVQQPCQHHGVPIGAFGHVNGGAQKRIRAPPGDPFCAFGLAGRLGGWAAGRRARWALGPLDAGRWALDGWALGARRGASRGSFPRRCRGRPRSISRPGPARRGPRTSLFPGTPCQSTTSTRRPCR